MLFYKNRSNSILLQKIIKMLLIVRIANYNNLSKILFTLPKLLNMCLMLKYVQCC